MPPTFVLPTSSRTLAAATRQLSEVVAPRVTTRCRSSVTSVVSCNFLDMTVLIHPKPRLVVRPTGSHPVSRIAANAATGVNCLGAPAGHIPRF